MPKSKKKTGGSSPIYNLIGDDECIKIIHKINNLLESNNNLLKSLPGAPNSIYNSVLIVPPLSCNDIINTINRLLDEQEEILNKLK